MKKSTLTIVASAASTILPLVLPAVMASLSQPSLSQQKSIFSSKEVEEFSLKVLGRGRLKIRRRLYKFSTPLWGQFKLRIDDEPFVLPVELIFNEVGHPLKEGETLVVRASTIKEAFVLAQQMMYDRGYRPSPSNEGFWL